MQKLPIHFVLIAFFSFLFLNSEAQKRISSNSELYGTLGNAFSEGDVVLFVSPLDARKMSIVRNSFSRHKIEVLSYFDLFLPGVEYTDNEIRTKLLDHDITKVIAYSVSSKAVTEHNSTEVNASYDSWSNSVRAVQTENNISYTSALGVKMTISRINKDKPFAIIISSAVGDWGMLTTEQGILKKAFNKIFRGLEKEGAFKK